MPRATCTIGTATPTTTATTPKRSTLPAVGHQRGHHGAPGRHDIFPTTWNILRLPGHIQLGLAHLPRQLRFTIVAMGVLTTNEEVKPAARKGGYFTKGRVPRYMLDVEVCRILQTPVTTPTIVVDAHNFPDPNRKKHCHHVG